MAVSVVPVQVLPTQARVDLHVVVAARTAAVDDASLPDAPEDRVELGVADVEAVVVAGELVPVGEIEGQGVGDVDGGEVPARLLPGDREKLRQELRRGDPVVRGDDEVVEADGHWCTSVPEVDHRYHSPGA